MKKKTNCLNVASKDSDCCFAGLRKTPAKSTGTISFFQVFGGQNLFLRQARRNPARCVMWTRIRVIMIIITSIRSTSHWHGTVTAGVTVTPAGPQ